MDRFILTSHRRGRISDLDFECLLSPIADARIKEKPTKRQTGNGQADPVVEHFDIGFLR